MARLSSALIRTRLGTQTRCKLLRSGEHRFCMFGRGVEVLGCDKREDECPEVVVVGCSDQLQGVAEVHPIKSKRRGRGRMSALANFDMEER